MDDYNINIIVIIITYNYTLLYLYHSGGLEKIETIKNSNYIYFVKKTSEIFIFPEEINVSVNVK